VPVSKSVTGAAGPFEGLDLAHENPVHQTASCVREVGVLELEASAAGSPLNVGLPGVEDRVFDADTLESGVPARSSTDSIRFMRPLLVVLT